MNSQEIITIVLQIILTGGIGTIAYFLKRTIDRIDKCESDIAKIKEDYITKEDFFREQGKTDRKLDRMMDILLEIKGGK
ncbi:hypothetical protein [Ruminococcus sp. 210702-SL.1.03]|uniref:hypothetical protein n=1 Tax=Ruminococcus sp. 210702-SL.1.03 TaxID=2883233 RepID=UPI001D0851E3|nr:hypothetical protein [Ruminococcus sp. 210702-SL.1.03]MCB6616948.1 hypothetical protein [Ruminococcus sp. 210702-SL.1.03]